MTKRSNTELARIRAAAKALRAEQRPEVAVSVLPAISGTLADARQIVARELQLMKTAQASNTLMTLAEAKKLQALMSSLAASQSIEKSSGDDMNEMSDEELAAELRKLGEGSDV